jgi:transcriptional regulator with XRE-family HTH domain
MRIVSNPLPVVAPFLRGVFQELLDEKNWDYRDLAKRAELSTNYVRRITLGTVRPNRSALRKLCAGADLDFNVVWDMWNHNDARNDAEGIGREKMRSMLREPKRDGPERDDPYHVWDGCVADVIEVFKALPQQGQWPIMNLAWKLAAEYNVQSLGPQLLDFLKVIDKRERPHE